MGCPWVPELPLEAMDSSCTRTKQPRRLAVDGVAMETGAAAADLRAWRSAISILFFSCLFSSPLITAKGISSTRSLATPNVNRWRTVRTLATRSEPMMTRRWTHEEPSDVWLDGLSGDGPTEIWESKIRPIKSSTVIVGFSTGSISRDHITTPRQRDVSSAKSSAFLTEIDAESPEASIDDSTMSRNSIVYEGLSSLLNTLIFRPSTVVVSSDIIVSSPPVAPTESKDNMDVNPTPLFSPHLMSPSWNSRRALESDVHFVIVTEILATYIYSNGQNSEPRPFFSALTDSSVFSNSIETEYLPKATPLENAITRSAVISRISFFASERSLNDATKDIVSTFAGIVQLSNMSLMTSRDIISLPSLSIFQSRASEKTTQGNGKSVQVLDVDMIKTSFDTDSKSLHSRSAYPKTFDNPFSHSHSIRRDKERLYTSVLSGESYLPTYNLATMQSKEREEYIHPSPTLRQSSVQIAISISPSRIDQIFSPFLSSSELLIDSQDIYKLTSPLPESKFPEISRTILTLKRTSMFPNVFSTSKVFLLTQPTARSSYNVNSSPPIDDTSELSQRKFSTFASHGGLVVTSSDVNDDNDNLQSINLPDHSFVTGQSSLDASLISVPVTSSKLHIYEESDVIFLPKAASPGSRNTIRYIVSSVSLENTVSVQITQKELSSHSRQITVPSSPSTSESLENYSVSKMTQIISTITEGSYESEEGTTLNSENNIFAISPSTSREPSISSNSHPFVELEGSYASIDAFYGILESRKSLHSSMKSDLSKDISSYGEFLNTFANESFMSSTWLPNTQDYKYFTVPLKSDELHSGYFSETLTYIENLSSTLNHIQTSIYTEVMSSSDTDSISDVSALSDQTDIPTHHVTARSAVDDRVSFVDTHLFNPSTKSVSREDEDAKHSSISTTEDKLNYSPYKTVSHEFRTSLVSPISESWILHPTDDFHFRSERIASSNMLQQPRNYISDYFTLGTTQASPFRSSIYMSQEDSSHQTKHQLTLLKTPKAQKSDEIYLTFLDYHSESSTDFQDSISLSRKGLILLNESMIDPFLDTAETGTFRPTGEFSSVGIGKSVSSSIKCPSCTHSSTPQAKEHSTAGRMMTASSLHYYTKSHSSYSQIPEVSTDFILKSHRISSHFSLELMTSYPTPSPLVILPFLSNIVTVSATPSHVDYATANSQIVESVFPEYRSPPSLNTFERYHTIPEIDGKGTRTFSSRFGMVGQQVGSSIFHGEFDILSESQSYFSSPYDILATYISKISRPLPSLYDQSFQRHGTSFRGLWSADETDSLKSTSGMSLTIDPSFHPTLWNSNLLTTSKDQDYTSPDSEHNLFLSTTLWDVFASNRKFGISFDSNAPHTESFNIKDREFVSEVQTSRPGESHFSLTTAGHSTSEGQSNFQLYKSTTLGVHETNAVVDSVTTTSEHYFSAPNIMDTSPYTLSTSQIDVQTVVNYGTSTVSLTSVRNADSNTQEEGNFSSNLNTGTNTLFATKHASSSPSTSEKSRIRTNVVLHSLPAVNISINTEEARSSNMFSQTSWATSSSLNTIKESSTSDTDEYGTKMEQTMVTRQTLVSLHASLNSPSEFNHVSFTLKSTPELGMNSEKLVIRTETPFHVHSTHSTLLQSSVKAEGNFMITPSSTIKHSEIWTFSALVTSPKGMSLMSSYFSKPSTSKIHSLETSASAYKFPKDPFSIASVISSTSSTSASILSPTSVSRTFDLPLGSSKFHEDTLVLKNQSSENEALTPGMESSTVPATEEYVNTTKFLVHPTLDSYLFKDKNFWILSVLESAFEKELPDNFSHTMELRLANAYSHAFTALRSKRDTNGTLDQPVYVLILSLTHHVLQGTVELVYIVEREGALVPATIAASTLSLLGHEQLRQFLGYHTIVKATPYIPFQSSVIDGGKAVPVAAIVGGILGSLLILLCCLWIYCKCCRPKSTSARSSQRSLSIYGPQNRQQIFHEDSHRVPIPEGSTKGKSADLKGLTKAGETAILPGRTLPHLPPIPKPQKPDDSLPCSEQTDETSTTKNLQLDHEISFERHHKFPDSQTLEIPESPRRQPRRKPLSLDEPEKSAQNDDLLKTASDIFHYVPISPPAFLKKNSKATVIKGHMQPCSSPTTSTSGTAGSEGSNAALLSTDHEHMIEDTKSETDTDTAEAQLHLARMRRRISELLDDAFALAGKHQVYGSLRSKKIGPSLEPFQRFTSMRSPEKYRAQSASEQQYLTKEEMYWEKQRRPQSAGGYHIVPPHFDNQTLEAQAPRSAWSTDPEHQFQENASPTGSSVQEPEIESRLSSGQNCRFMLRTSRSPFGPSSSLPMLDTLHEHPVPATSPSVRNAASELYLACSSRMNPYAKNEYDEIDVISALKEGEPVAAIIQAIKDELQKLNSSLPGANDNESSA